MLRIRRHPDVRAFLAAAEPWLLREEERYGLLLGVAYQVRGGKHRYRQPIYWATVWHGELLVGCAFRTPPHQVGVTDLPEDAVEPLVTSVRETYSDVPGVAGPERTATAFARAWTARSDGSWGIDHHQQLFSLSAVTFPSDPAPGALRLAIAPDVPVARAWMAGFIRDTGVRHLGADTAERLIEQRRLYFWVDGQPRCMVGAVRDTPNTTGIAAVYTPPQFRNRGYASIAVATLSRELLEAGRKSCFLYADAANATSTGLYRRLGYDPIDDVVDIWIV